MIQALTRAAISDIKDGGPKDDEAFDERNWGMKRLFLSSLTTPFQGIPIIGDSFQAAVYGVAGEWLPKGNLFDAIPKAAKRIGHVPEWFTGEREMIDAVKDAEAILTAMGVASDTLAGAASLSHLVRDIYGTVVNFTE